MCVCVREREWKRYVDWLTHQFVHLLFFLFLSPSLPFSLLIPSRIDGIDPVPCHNRTFMEGDREVSVAEYFRTKYDIRLQYPHSPTVVVRRQKGDTYFPMELVIVSPNQKLPGCFAQAEKVICWSETVSCLPCVMCVWVYG